MTKKRTRGTRTAKSSGGFTIKVGPTIRALDNFKSKLEAKKDQAADKAALRRLIGGIVALRRAIVCQDASMTRRF